MGVEHAQAVESHGLLSKQVWYQLCGKQYSKKTQQYVVLRECGSS